MHKLSIVIPVYNVEKYLEACLDSIFSQITDECQVVLVDDGSTDKSGEMCDAYAAKYSGTVVLHQENAGQGNARNNGVAASDGEYVFFIDSDDTIEQGALSKALADIDRFGTDMIIYPVNMYASDNSLEVKNDGYEYGKVYSTAENTGLICIFPAPWNKLVRASLFKEQGVAFPSKVWYEDLRTTPKLVCLSGSVAFSDAPLYNYYYREGSTMNNSKVERNVEIVAAIDDLIDWFKGRGAYEKYKKELDFLTVEHLFISASVRVIRCAGGGHHLVREFREYTKKNCADIKSNPYVMRLPKNRRLILKLLCAKMYFAVKLIFKIKDGR